MARKLTNSNNKVKKQESFVENISRDETISLLKDKNITTSPTEC